MENVAAFTPCADATSLLSSFQFALPPELIAQVPAKRRDSARLLVLNRETGALQHAEVSRLPEHLHPGDLLVINDTRVIPARLFGCAASGGAVELLLIRPTAGEHRWMSLGKPARRLRLGAAVWLVDGTVVTVTAVHGDGRYTVAFDTAIDVAELLKRHGELPLPPYIRRPDGPLPLDQTRYQTIFATSPGAIAAPTAGLHFTAELIEALRNRGVRLASLTLHVGPGTFLPVRTDDMHQHVMEPEWCDIPESTATAIGEAKAERRRIVAVGTTTTRALESAAAENGAIQAGARWADRFIVPGYRFRVIDALFTNFHLPGSTLLLLVSAFAGRERIMATYTHAVRQRYRFYSYGDVMLIQ
jgi:S-adenosylmethionine:tRNA ribosyltransferase-isomerase